MEKKKTKTVQIVFWFVAMRLKHTSHTTQYRNAILTRNTNAVDCNVEQIISKPKPHFEVAQCQKAHRFYEKFIGSLTSSGTYDKTFAFGQIIIILAECVSSTLQP